MNSSSKLPAMLQGDSPKQLGQGAIVGAALIAIALKPKKDLCFR
jgi:hypothetical protein